MAYLTLLYLQTNAAYRRCVNYPSDKALEMASSQMDVLRHNHRQMEKQHGVAMYKKESCIDLREDIAMVKNTCNKSWIERMPSAGGLESTAA